MTQLIRYQVTYFDNETETCEEEKQVNKGVDQKISDLLGLMSYFLFHLYKY